MARSRIITLTLLVGTLAACGSGKEQSQYGPDPRLPGQKSGLLPDMSIASPTGWGRALPKVPAGYTITPLATGLKIPRQMIVMPNGDVLVAEGSGASAPPLRPKDLIAGLIKARGKSKVKGGNRISLLRDADGDGRADLKTVLLDGLDAPYGLAFVNGALFVANQGELLRYPYLVGQTKITAPGAKVTDLPSQINHHWTKALAASPDGTKLYVGIGSNSNITERGMAAEVDRAMVWEIDAATGAHRPFATGLRNPTALAFQPGTGQLWTTVNERDELGPDLVPDYVTSVREGAFYGWPYSYWGQHVDPRVHPQDPKKVASAIAPDYALGSHVAALGLAFSSPAMGARFGEGLFVGMHGSWNRKPFSGYKVVFIGFVAGKPTGQPIDVVTGFLDGDKARGRPVGVALDPRGALLVADDLSNTVWRIAPSTQPRPATSSPSPPAG
ncbi:sorbosone dehydrogenase family protein [Novosphingobium sp. PS1R-30]|uniref:Sorbosone dehydrogenase family protein n=1 Tax=Novosphingobium anseongense TaxID=3133436 RepID=A0ABU8S330_9SPHN